MSWQAIYFLEDAARRILLYKDGGGYRFIHRLFLDYFANLEASSFSTHQTKNTDQHNNIPASSNASHHYS
jgi:hypothetical protein